MFQAFKGVDPLSKEGRNCSLGPQIEVPHIDEKAFKGQITDLNVWDRPLSDDELVNFTKNCVDQRFHQIGQPNIIDWSVANFAYNKSLIETFEVDRGQFCWRPKSEVVMFPIPSAYGEALTSCDNLGGQFPLPASVVEFNKILSRNFSKGKK